MTELTIAMDERVLERARSRASRQGASLDTLVRCYVETYAGGEEDQRQAAVTLLDLSRRAEGGSGGRRWTRDDLHLADAGALEALRSRAIEQEVLELLDEAQPGEGWLAHLENEVSRLDLPTRARLAGVLLRSLKSCR